MNRKSLSTIVGATLVTSLAGAVQASDNPFTLKELASGYRLAEVTPNNQGTSKSSQEMVCGEGKCGGNAAKSPEMNCGAMKSQPTTEEQKKAIEAKCAGQKTDAAPSTNSPKNP